MSSSVPVYPLCYFAPVPWFAATMHEAHFCLSCHDPYRKQQYSSRAFIKLPNRIFPLTIPIERRSAHAPVADKRIAYQQDWQRQHWRSICTAYGAAPYFDYYSDRLAAALHQRHTWLGEHLLHLHHSLCSWLHLPVNWTPSTAWVPPDAARRDYRAAFDPSLRTLPPWFVPVPYQQVFGDFVPGLSILDLLLNVGPESRLMLQHSYRG
ncbi:MAG: WbqC family protein [Bacteroidia bacterium]